MNVADASQLDTDRDGDRNACDCDVNQDGLCGDPDFTLVIGCLDQATGDDPICRAADMSGDGFVGRAHFSLSVGGLNLPPGPWRTILTADLQRSRPQPATGLRAGTDRGTYRCRAGALLSARRLLPLARDGDGVTAPPGCGRLGRGV